ncbi:MAG: 50S ribosomal protein L10 [Waddliaceae bacterium]|nr:50S ribosomal protein L10 [Waddliaceae bacterium]
MRAEKQLLLDDLVKKFKAPAFVVVKHGMTANDANDFRRQIDKTGGEFEVVRKRVLMKAAEAAEVDLDGIPMEGHIGVVFTGEDSVETTKVVCESSFVSAVGGRFDGQVYLAADVEKLSKLPGKDEMRAQLLGLFEAPQAQVLGTMEALLTSVMHCLQNKVDQDGSSD